MKSLLVNEFGIDPAKLVPVLHFDGTPITARFIARAITESMCIGGAMSRERVA